jgi:hypothetical protein
VSDSTESSGSNRKQSWLRICLRAAVIAAALIVTYYLAPSGAVFFYQGF